MCEPAKDLTNQNWIVLGLFALVIMALSLSLLVHVFRNPEASGAVVASLVFGIVALPIILVLVVPNFRGNLSAIRVGPTGVDIRIESIGKQAQAAEDTALKAFDQVKKFIFLGMPFSHYYNLRKMAKHEDGREGQNFGSFRMDEGFRGQLRYLRDSGYITVQGSIGELPDRGEDLNKFVAVTKLGQEFITLRQQYT
jgi:hypothetical protein